MRHPDDGGAQGLELVGGLRELVCFDGAAGRECGGVEIQHHGSLLEGIGERELERLARERRLRREVRCLRTRRQGGVQRCGQDAGANCHGNKAFHE